MDITDIHRQFYSFRNGIVAKTIKDAGMPYHRVFGLQLPQLASIARETGHDNVLALQLWEERECREARLLACYLFDPATLGEETALKLAGDVQCREEADILAWRLLRYLPYADQLLQRLDGYVAEALSRNLQ